MKGEDKNMPTNNKHGETCLIKDKRMLESSKKKNDETYFVQGSEEQAARLAEGTGSSPGAPRRR